MNYPLPSRPLERKRQPSQPFIRRVRPPSRRELCEALGLTMTVCIAAKTFYGDLIITVSDRSLSYGTLVPSSDDTLKAIRLWDTWGVLFSGDDPVPGIISAVQTELYPHIGKLTVELVKNAFRKVWRKSAEQRATDRHLARLGFASIEDFHKTGLARLGSAEFARINFKIENFDPGLSFLVYGFDQDEFGQRAHIFEVHTHRDTPGEERDLITDDDLQGFGLIGSGLWPALGVLTSRSVGTIDDADEVAYALCEAKFAADSTSTAGVGKATTLMAFNKKGKMVQFTPGEIDRLRTIWNEARKNPVPDDASTILTDKLNRLIFGEDS